MSRIRTIKPEYWTSGKQIRLSAEAALLNISLWNFADDDGRLNDDLDEIAARCPRRFLSNIDQLLIELEHGRLIMRYEAGSPRRRYIQVHDWHDHQRINRPRPSGIPGPIAEPDTSITLPASFQNAGEVIRAMADPNMPYQEVPPTVAYIAPSDLTPAQVQEHLRVPGKVEEMTPQQIEDIRRFGSNPDKYPAGALIQMMQKSTEESVSVHGTVTEPSLNLNNLPNNIVSESSVTTHGTLTESSLLITTGSLPEGITTRSEVPDKKSKKHDFSQNCSQPVDNSSIHGTITEPSVNNHGTLSESDKQNPNLRKLDEFGVQIYKRYVEKFGKEDLDPIFYGRIAMYLRRLGPECVNAALQDTLATRSVINPKAYLQTLLKRDLDAQIKGN